MFQFPRFASLGYVFTQRWSDMTRTGFPHSGILGLASVCDYPRLIAAYHALHRLLMPRHPPYTLSSLTPNRIATRGLNLVETRITYSIVKEQRELHSRNRKTRLHSCRICVELTVRIPSTASQLVEMSGIEPLTPCLQSRCSPI